MKTVIESTPMSSRLGLVDHLMLQARVHAADKEHLGASRRAGERRPPFRVAAGFGGLVRRDPSLEVVDRAPHERWARADDQPAEVDPRTLEDAAVLRLRVRADDPVDVHRRVA